MPALTRWFVRTALLYFIAALGLGAAMQSAALTSAMPALGAAWPSYIHLLMVGWITGLIFGVAYWLFPRGDRRGPTRSEPLGWLAYGCLNAGLVLRAVVEPAVTLEPMAPARWLLVPSALLQLAGVCAFAIVIWPRVRTR